LIIVKPDSVYILQLTFKLPSEKIPVEGSSYSAIYSDQKYLDLNSPLGPGGNFATKLLSLTQLPQITTVTLKEGDGGKKYLVDQNGEIVNLTYIIVSTTVNDILRSSLSLSKTCR